MTVMNSEIETAPYRAAQLDLSVVVPAYNEETRLPAYLDKILSYLEFLEISFEIIVVDDGSTDSTAKIVGGYSTRAKNVRLIRLPNNRGKGFAVKTGMLQAIGAQRLFADADGATPITELDRLRRAIQDGADVAIGSRALRDDTCVIKAHLYRKVIGRVFSFLVNSLTVRGIKDTQCGFKLFTAESAGAAFSRQTIDDFGFDVEVLFICRSGGYRITEVTVNWSDQKGSKVRLIRDSVRMFMDLLKVRSNDLRGVYCSSVREVCVEPK